MLLINDRFQIGVKMCYVPELMDEIHNILSFESLVR
jgi:hypothetical protein